MGDIANIPPTGATVAKAGAEIGTRRRTNLIEGTNVTLDVVDDPVNNEVDITINAPAAGGGAPTGAAYLVAAADATLTDDRLATDTATIDFVASAGVAEWNVKDGSITNAKAATMAARTVKANATNAVAAPQDLAGGGDGTVFQDTGTAVVCSALTKIIQALFLSGDISPAQITAAATLNNFDPASLSTSSVLLLTSDAAYDWTGLAGGEDGRIIVACNLGSFALTVKDQSASSTAGNRFELDADIALRPNEVAIFRYNVAASENRWRCIARNFRIQAGNSTISVVGDSVSVATGGITGNEIAAAIKDAAAGTASLRTLGTSSTSACAGNDARLSDTRTPTNATVTEAKFAVVVGNVVFALTDGANIAVNRDNGKNQKVTIAGNRTVDAPTGTLIDGMFLILAIRQDGTGGRTITFAGGVGGFRATSGCSLTPTLSAAPDKTDYVVARHDVTDNKWDLVQRTLAA